MTQEPTRKYLLSLLLLTIFSLSVLVPSVSAWSNGGYSTEPSNPDYGTHDWIAQHAKDWLSAAERKWIDDNLNYFLYGTEYPDNSGASYGTTNGYGDTAKHHNYYNNSGFIIDGSAANRAKSEYDKALTELKAGRNVTAAIYAGSMTHYIDDMAVFGHVMTDEIHHSDYEDYVNSLTSSYSYGVFEQYLVFDGELGNVSAYDASSALGRNTFTDAGGTYTAYWMDTYYDWSNSAFNNRCRESLNLAVNYVADVLHELVTKAFGAITAENTTTLIPTTIACSISTSEVTEGDSVTISGSISPSVSGKTVTLTFKKPNNFSTTKTALTGSNGFYNISNKFDAVGLWSVSAEWTGDSSHYGASSSSLSINVKRRSCIIATATYGSELSAEVQFLREYRDSKVLSTFIGISFMTIFDMFYYSFSPYIASLISENEILRSLIKLVLYPMIGALHLSTNVFSVFSFIPELAMAVAGLVASLLIAIVYILPLVLFFSFLKKYRPSLRLILWIVFIWIGGVVGMALAEATTSMLLMMMSSVAFILATMVLVTLILTRTISRLRIH